MTFWMGLASAQHVRRGRDGGFAQLGHGKHIAVKSLTKGDWIVYCSPREGIGEGDVVQAFTALGRVYSLLRVQKYHVVSATSEHA